MKKTYINPAMEIVKLEMKNVVLTASALSVGENWENGEGAARESTLDDED
ncbi:MAG: hypothetical protein IJ155_01795 [Prevotella sp.]|nr:hypothetical protein [Prevotella sp.]